MLRRSVHFAGYAMVWAMLAVFGLGTVAAVGSGLACRMDSSIALCTQIDEAIQTIAKRER